MKVNDVIKIHFVGIGGISMSALAMFFIKKGCQISGSDLIENGQIKLLKQKGAKIAIGHAKKNVPIDTDLCVYTGAVSFDNSEIAFCLSKGIKTINRADLLGEVFSAYKYNIAVSGSHGKTTTTALIYEILHYSGLSPTLFLGGEYRNEGNLHIGDGDFCVAEACEYKKSFLSFYPYISLLLNAELDHTDCFNSREDIYKAFSLFAQNTQQEGVCVINETLKNKMSFTAKNTVTFGFDTSNTYYAKNLLSKNGYYTFDVFSANICLGTIQLNVAGKHNVNNALAAYAVAKQFDLPQATIAEGIKGFKGVFRRYQTFECSFTNVVADYAHHPTEIIAALNAAKEQGYQNIYVLFQPHTYSRTLSLMKDFACCFEGAKQVVVLPVYAAREKPIKSGNHKSLAKRIKENTPCIALNSFSKASHYLKKHLHKNDLLLVLGAGDIINFCIPKYL